LYSISSLIIYEVHTEGEVKLKWTHVDRGGGSAPCGHSHRKLEPTDVIVSSLNAKKVVYFVPEFRLWTEFPGRVEIFCGNK